MPFCAAILNTSGWVAYSVLEGNLYIFFGVELLTVHGNICAYGLHIIACRTCHNEIFTVPWKHVQCI